MTVRDAQADSAVHRHVKLVQVHRRSRCGPGTRSVGCHYGPHHLPAAAGRHIRSPVRAQGLDQLQPASAFRFWLQVLANRQVSTGIPDLNQDLPPVAGQPQAHGRHPAYCAPREPGNGQIACHRRYMASKGPPRPPAVRCRSRRFNARDQRSEWCGPVRVGLGEGIVALAWITWRNSTLAYQYLIVANQWQQQS